jgi:hypothetical protein
LGTEKNKIFKMDDALGGGFQTYSGNFQFPANPVGCDYDNGYLMVYGITPLDVRVGRYDTGQNIVSWQNTTVAANAFTNGDIKTGVMVVPTSTDTFVMSVFNGTFIDKMNTNHDIEFSDVDPSFYYVDKTTNQYALRHVRSPNPVPSCQIFLVGV